MGVYIKGLSIEQVKTLLDCAGGDGLGEAFETYLVEVPEPHGDLIDRDKHVALPKTDGKVTVVIEAEPHTDYRIMGVIGYRCPKCGKGNFLKEESKCVYCGEPLIKEQQ